MNERLAASYQRCRALHRAHGRTYYLATRLLPRWKRRHVHALYGFTRYTDDLVDTGDPAARRQRLDDWTRRFTDALAGQPVDDPVLPAVLHTIALFELDHADLTAFLRSMSMDLTVTAYPTYDDLLQYMEGSAAAIGTMMLPILLATRPGTGDRQRCLQAREPARQLGFAFQLTNFIRDIGEDLARGRVYLPAKDLADFGVVPDDLRAGSLTAPVRDLLAFEVARAREHYARAAPGIPMLPPRSQACIRAAYRLYGGILDDVVRAGYDVFSRRARVGEARRIVTAMGCLLAPPGRAPRRLPGTWRTAAGGPGTHTRPDGGP